jgi:hypothetical protein
MQRQFNNDSTALLPFASAVNFDNRFLVTAQPKLVTFHNELRGIAHAGIGVLDFYPISGMATSLGNAAMPSWDGIWTGLQVLQLLVVGSDTPRCFAFTLNPDTTAIELWELSRDQRFDNRSNPISWFLETPAYGFVDGGWSLKRLNYADAWFDRIAGSVDFTASYREDVYPFWNSWHNWNVCAPVQACAVTNCHIPQTAEQYRSRQRLPRLDANACDSITDKPHRDGYRFQMKLEVSGFCRVRQLRLIAENLPEDVVGGCP